MKRIVPRTAAEQDIDEAADYYAIEAGEDMGHQFVEAIRDTYGAIAAHPAMGSPRYADLLDIEGLRSRKLHRYPYLVFYVERDDHIDVWRVLHAQRDISTALHNSRLD